jgi:hypothetical protein
MPGGGHSLPICLTIFGRGTPILCDDGERQCLVVSCGLALIFHELLLVDSLGKHQRAKFIVTMSPQVFWLRACVAFRLSHLLSDVHAKNSGTSSISFGNRK